MTKHYNIVSLLLLACILICGSYTKANAQVSLIFVKNIGQVQDQHGNSRSDIDFRLATGNGLNLFISSNAIYYQWAKVDRKMNPIAVSTDDLLNNDPMEMYRMDVQLVGADPNATHTEELLTYFYERYYTLGLNGAKASSYRKVTYHNVYPNIDWVFYFNAAGKLEHDFIVRPGGRVEDIQLKYSGAISLKVNPNGSLTAITPMGSITEQAPISFQKGNKKSIESKYVLNNNLLSFSTSQYTGTLVIDPTVEWGTYFGGIENDDIKKTITDKANHLYATGATSSLDNIATIGSHQTTFGGGSSSAGADAFLAKFATDGTKLWSTYYGGSDIDAASAITCDTSGYIYIAGKTKSPSGIATIGTHQQTIGGGIQVDDAFIVKFDSTGERQWGTYFGGESQDAHTAVDIHCDKNNNIYFTGNTVSNTGIATVGAFQLVRNGTSVDGLLAKFNSSGNLQWATYYGGPSQETPQTISADELGNIYMAGNTISTSGMATTGAHQAIFGGGTNDGFVAKFDPNGQRLWGTYLGGTSNDLILSIKNDELGHLYIAGTSNSTSGIATANAYQTALGGAQDIL
ncbi:SBBP repeat-containing protein [Sphingobacterium sp. KU25419]|nr:SBBP repeat-containing protein [Sphingobacterium sp. KU25419]